MVQIISEKAVQHNESAVDSTNQAHEKLLNTPKIVENAKADFELSIDKTGTSLSHRRSLTIQAYKTAAEICTALAETDPQTEQLATAGWEKLLVASDLPNTTAAEIAAIGNSGNEMLVDYVTQHVDYLCTVNREKDETVPNIPADAYEHVAINLDTALRDSLNTFYSALESGKLSLEDTQDIARKIEKLASLTLTHAMLGDYSAQVRATIEMEQTAAAKRGAKAEQAADNIAEGFFTGKTHVKGPTTPLGY